MSSGRTNWWSKDAAWWGRSAVIKAGREHGPLAPAVLDFIICEAKAQNPTATEEGWVKVGYEAIAYRATFGTSDDVRIRPVVATLVRVGLLDDFEEDGDVFTCRISGWREDVFLPLEAARKAKARNRKTPANEPDPPTPAASAESEASGDVRECPEKSSTRPDKTTEDDDDSSAGARASHPLFDQVMERLTTVADLLPVGVHDDISILAEIEEAQNAGDDPLELAEATVGAIRDYHHKGTLTARSVSNVMASVRRRRAQHKDLQLAVESTKARVAYERPAKPSRAEQARADAARLRAAEQETDAA